MTASPSPQISKVERDPRLFMWLMTLVVAGIYVVTLMNQPSVRRLGVLIPYTVLLLVHMVLHWQLEKLTQRPNWVLWYMIIQGGLALIISWLGNETGMTFALFMSLIGEAVGLFRLTRPG